VAVTGQPQGAGGRVVEVEKLADNLYMMRGPGFSTT
jgi:hypothetical protein